MTFRIVKSGRSGKYRVERKGWFGWNLAIVHPHMWGALPAEYDSVEGARADMVRIFKTPDEVVWESE